jgi:hypothetical protein
LTLEWRLEKRYPEARPAAGGMLPEVFGRAVELEDGSHADVLLPAGEGDSS